MSVQERYAPENRCFGCGPANAQGLRIRSFPTGGEGDELTAAWVASPHHEAFTGMLNGGITGALLDCHSNWTAAWHLYNKTKATELPSTVTADFHVTLKAPTPSRGPVHLSAKVVESTDRKAVIEAELSVDGQVTATCRGTFVAVRQGHPAYHRWQ